MKKAMLLMGILVLLGPALFAETITLEQVRTLALANSRSLAKYNLAIQSTALDEKARVYSNLPSLSLGASASMSLWNSSGPLEKPFDTFKAGASVSVSQSLFEGGKSVVQKAINEIASESARKDAQAEYFNVLDSADSAYYAVLEAAATLEAAETALQSSTASLNIAEIRQASGMINQSDYLKALADKETQENSRNQARRALSLAAAKLKSLIGADSIPEPEQIDFSGYGDLISYLGNISDEKADSLYNQFWNLLTAANPSLAKASLASQMAEKNLSLAKRSYSPSLSASFSTGLNWTPDSGLGVSGGSVSLSASIPVNYWSIANSVEKSKIAMDSAALDYLSAGTQLETDLQTALIDTFTQAESVLSSSRSLEYAQKNFDYVQELYRLSQSSVSDLGDASSLLITSRNNLIKSRFGFLQSLSKLRSLGAIDDEQKLEKILMGT